MSEMPILGWLAALGSAACWTASAVFYKMGTRTANSLDANTARALPTIGILLLMVIIIRGVGFLNGLTTQAVILSLLSGIVGLALGDSLYISSIHRTGVALAVPVSGIYPILTAAVGYAFFQIQLPSLVVIGTLTIVLGLGLLTYEKPSGSNSIKAEKLGIAYALLAAVVWSFSINWMNQALTLGNPLDINLVRSSTLLLLFPLQPLQARRGQGITRLTKRAWTAMSAGGIMGLSLGWTLLAYSTDLIGVARAVPLSSISPFFSVLAGAILLKERVTPYIYLGSLLIVSGAVAVSLP